MFRNNEFHCMFCLYKGLLRPPSGPQVYMSVLIHSERKKNEFVTSRGRQRL